MLKHLKSINWIDKMIPVCEPKFFGKEKEYVNECLDTNWISSAGEYIELFEDSFSKFIGTRFGVACSNGSTALNIAMEALQIKRGDEVIVTNLSNIATINGIIFSGAKPVLVDVDKKTYGIDPAKIEEKVNDRTKAIVLVHLYGHPVDMDPVMEIAKKHKLFVVEDCAEAHGAEYKGRKVGSFGDISTFSFYANKIVTTGEGGMVLTNNEELAERARLIRNLGFTEPRFHHSILASNYRMTNIQAAIGYAQMEKIDKILLEKQRIYDEYTKLLSGTQGIALQSEAEWAKKVCWMYCILIEPEFGLTRDEVMQKLHDQGIQTRAFFYPFHRQPLFEGEDDRFPDCEGDYPISDELAEKGLYLPSGAGLSNGQIKSICGILLSIKEEK